MKANGWKIARYNLHQNIIDVLLMAKDHAQKFFRYMNPRHPEIKFTCEEENNKKL